MIAANTEKTTEEEYEEEEEEERKEEKDSADVNHKTTHRGSGTTKRHNLYPMC